MAVRLAAPVPLISTYTFLPNPEFGDTEGFTADVVVKRSMNNTLYSYVKQKDGRKRLLMRFRLTRMKALELRAFIRAYYRTEIELLDHEGQRWLGWITTNPNEFEYATAVTGGSAGGRSLATIQIEFEGMKQ